MLQLIMELGFYCFALAIAFTFAAAFTYWIALPFLAKQYITKQKESMQQYLTKIRLKLQKAEGKQKFAFIGSSQYQQLMKDKAEEYRAQGHTVFLPYFDEDADSALVIWSTNKEIIDAADVVVIFWDQRSTGTIFDLGMTFMAGKPLRIGFLESRTIGTTLIDYASKT